MIHNLTKLCFVCVTKTCLSPTCNLTALLYYRAQSLGGQILYTPDDVDDWDEDDPDDDLDI